MSFLAARSDGKPWLFRADSVGTSLSLYLPATVGSRLMGLIRGVALAWLMSESQYGLLQVALLWIAMMQPLLGVGLNEAMARYVPQYETRHALRSFLARAVSLAVLIGAILSGLAWLAAAPLARFFLGAPPEARELPDAAATSALGRLAAITTFCLIVYFLMLAILRGLRMFRAISLIETVYQVGYTVVAVVLAASGYKSTRAMLACYAASVLATTLVFAPWLTHLVVRAPDQRESLSQTGEGRSLLEQMLRFSVWAALAAVMWQTLHYYPMWYLHKVCGRHGEVTAVFAGVRLLTQVVLVVAVAVAAVVQTSVTKTWESRGRETADRQLLLAFKTTVLLLLAISGLLAVSARLLVRLYPASYREGAAIVAPLALTWLICAYLLLLAINFSLIEKTRHVFLPWCLGLLCNVAFSRWLVQPHLSAEEALKAAAWAGVLGITPALILSVTLLKAERRPLDLGTWLLLGVTWALVLPMPLMVPVIALVLLLAVGTATILDHQEKQQIRDALTAGHGKVRQALAQLVGWL